MICTGSGCDRAAKCGLYYRNPQPEHRKYDNVEPLSEFGSGSLSSEGCDITYWCGPLGDYKMFQPISEELKLEILQKQFNAFGYNIKTTTLQDILKEIMREKNENGIAEM